MPADDAKRRLFERAAAAAADYLEAERLGPVSPGGDLGDCLVGLRQFNLDDPGDPSQIVETLADLGRRYAVRSSGGRYFGFVTGGTEPTALAASVLATVWDQNAGLPVMSPLAHAADVVAGELVLDILGLPETSVAAFCGGASVANLTAIIAARDALYRAVGWDVAVDGLTGAPALSVLVSAEIHVSVHKALRLAGIGSTSVTPIPVDSTGRIEAGLVPDIDGPTLLIAQAGNVNTGHSDPVDQILARLPHDSRLGADDPASSRPSSRPGPVWVHVDGAFGLWARASERLRSQVAGADKVDSWAVDCHKWLNVPYDNGVVIVADPRHLRRAMAADAAYLHRPDDDKSPMHLGLQMSQSARAVPVWAALAALGRAGVADIVDRCCRLAARFGDCLEEAGAELLAPVVLNQVLVAFGSEQETNAVVEAVAADGVCWMGATTWRGRRAMRISVSDMATTVDDVDRSVDAILVAWSGVVDG